MFGNVREELTVSGKLWCTGAGASGFTSLDLAISEFGSTHKIRSIQEGLRGYFKSETLDGDNQYHCEKCEKEGRGAKQDAEKGLKLSKVPYVLSIGLKRFDYDWERDCRVKVDDEVVFPPVLDMAEFFDMDAAPAPEPESAPAMQTAAGENGPADQQAEEGTPPVEHCGFGTHVFATVCSTCLGLNHHGIGSGNTFPPLCTTVQVKTVQRSGQRT